MSRIADDVLAAVGQRRTPSGYIAATPGQNGSGDRLKWRITGAARKALDGCDGVYQTSCRAAFPATRAAWCAQASCVPGRPLFFVWGERMKVYLSAQWNRRREMEGYADVLRFNGFEIVSTWHALSRGGSGTPQEDDDDRDRWEEYARKDMDEIASADLYLAFTEPEGTMSRGGRHVEFGMAISDEELGVAVIGPTESQFYTLADGYFIDFTDFLAGYNIPHDAPRKEGR